MGHNYIGHNYIGNNCIGHNYMLQEHCKYRNMGTVSKRGRWRYEMSGRMFIFQNALCLAGMCRTAQHCTALHRHGCLGAAGRMLGVEYKPP